MFVQPGSHCSINITRQHKVRLRGKPALLLAVCLLSGFLASCGRFAVEGYMSRDNDTAGYNEMNEDPETTYGLYDPVEISYPEHEPTDTPEPEHQQGQEVTPDTEGINTPEPSVTAMPSETPEPEVTPDPAPTSAPAPKPSSTHDPKTAVTPAPTAPPETLKGAVNPYVPYTYDQMREDCLELEALYPDIISLDTAGRSVEGRDLTLIKLGKGEKKIILCGSHHAREYISSTYLMKMTEEYAKAYYGSGSFGNYDVRNILDQICIYIVPMVNPDGVNLVINGIEAVGDKEAVTAMAMLRNTYREWKANINGVDLNRQYPAEWEKKYDEVGRPASESFKGESSATEPEVKAMMELSKANVFILAASFHTKGNVIYWADRATVDLIPGVKDLAKRLSKLTKYSLMPVSEDPRIYAAGYENWFRLEFLRPAFCIELTPYNNTDVPHNDKKFDDLVWKNAKYIGLFLAEEAINNSWGL